MLSLNYHSTHHWNDGNLYIFKKGWWVCTIAMLSVSISASNLRHLSQPCLSASRQHHAPAPGSEPAPPLRLSVDLWTPLSSTKSHLHAQDIEVNSLVHGRWGKVLNIWFSNSFQRLTSRLAYHRQGTNHKVQGMKPYNLTYCPLGHLTTVSN